MNRRILINSNFLKVKYRYYFVEWLKVIKITKNYSTIYNFI